MADKTTYLHSLLTKYFNTKEYKIEEDSIKFVYVVDLSGENSAHTISRGLDLTNCREQAFDGSSNINGIFKGVQARIFQIQSLTQSTATVPLQKED